MCLQAIQKQCGIIIYQIKSKMSSRTICIKSGFCLLSGLDIKNCIIIRVQFCVLLNFDTWSERKMAIILCLEDISSTGTEIFICFLLFYYSFIRHKGLSVNQNSLSMCFTIYYVVKLR